MNSDAQRAKRAAKKLERRRRREEKKAAAQRRREPDTPTTFIVRTAPSDGPNKMSAVLREFATPLLEPGPAELLGSAQESFALACLAWNAEVLAEHHGGDDASKVLAEFERTRPVAEARAFREFFEMMRERKREFFATDHRYVAGCEVIDEGDNLRVLAASTVLN